MKILMKHSAGALALSAAMLSMSAGAQVAPAGKPVKPPAEVVQPAPSVDIETGQLLIRVPPSAQKTSDTPPPVEDAAAPASTEKGIKDPGVKGCGNCGLTGREAAPPPADDAAAPDDASARKIETGQLLIKDRPAPTSAAKKKKKGPKVRDDSVSTQSSLLPVLGGVAALAALAVAVGGGNDGPTSP